MFWEVVREAVPEMKNKVEPLDETLKNPVNSAKPEVNKSSCCFSWISNDSDQIEPQDRYKVENNISAGKSESSAPESDPTKLQESRQSVKKLQEESERGQTSHKDSSYQTVLLSPEIECHSQEKINHNFTSHEMFTAIESQSGEKQTSCHTLNNNEAKPDQQKVQNKGSEEQTKVLTFGNQTEGSRAQFKPEVKGDAIFAKQDANSRVETHAQFRCS